MLWTTPSEPPKALQASECSELLDPMRASCLILAQHQPGKFKKWSAMDLRRNKESCKQGGVCSDACAKGIAAWVGVESESDLGRPDLEIGSECSRSNPLPKPPLQTHLAHSILVAELHSKHCKQNAKSTSITPKGAPHLTLCSARATREWPTSKLVEPTPQRKIGVTSKTPVGVISVVTLIRTDTTLDHSQKAEKV